MKKRNSKIPDDLLWQNIQNRLDEYSDEQNRTYLTQAINELPVYVPAESAWNNIESKLDQQHSKVISIRRSVFIWSSIAASLLLAFGFWYFNLPSSNTEKYAYSEEELSIPQIATANDTLLNQFLEQQCASLPDKCESPRFAELHEKYQQLEVTQASIRQTLADDPGNENMLACVRRIENDKVQLKKQLLKYFAS